jgi:multiple sugar transport system permease protein
MVVTSLKMPGESFLAPSLFPKKISFDSFILQNEHGISLLTYFKNSMIIAFGATGLTVLLAIPAAYGLAMYKSRFTSILLLIFLVAQMMPSSLILTPLFINFNKFNLINNYLGVILADATLTIPFSVIILRTYFKGIPKALEDAARIDGCGPVKTFVKIMLPICSPGIVVSISMSLFMAWGDMVFSLTFLNKEKLKPLSLILYKAMGELGVRWEILMAYATVVVIPIVIMFIFLQKYLVSGLTAGSIKG